MDKRNIVIGFLGLLLIGMAVGAWMGKQNSSQRMTELESEISILKQKEINSAIDKSVSAQMEDIAYQQKAISDEEREKALQQTRVANELRLQSEKERQNAIEAQRKAVEASALAENQRQIAEHQRIQAELSKSVTDTLRYIALGRSLGSLSTTQYKTGNQDIADLLSFAAYLYTEKYHGDIYYPAIYQSLSESSQSKREWARHHGALTNLAFLSKSDDKLVSVSNYGEVLLHEKNGNQLHTKTLFANKAYDFRDVYVDAASNDIFAVSRSGHIFCKTANQTRVIPVSNVVHPMWLSEIGKRTLLIIGENDIAILDKPTHTITSARHLDFRVICVSRTNYLPLLFDDKGKMHIVQDIQTLISKKVPVPGRVSAFAESKSSKFAAYGMNDGTLFLLDNNNKVHRLIGHRSRISKIKINGTRIYSSSYDGTVNLWVGNSKKPEPMTLISDVDWIMNFTFDPSKNYIWTGDQRGHLTEALISVPLMVERIQKNLKRDLTDSEWLYYIGQNVPYEELRKVRIKSLRKEAE